jgi:hypothetical protein
MEPHADPGNPERDGRGNLASNPFLRSFRQAWAGRKAKPFTYLPTEMNSKFVFATAGEVTAALRAQTDREKTLGFVIVPRH